MDFLLDFILHIDQYMVMIVRDYHAWTYAILFSIIFCETGLVVTPFLPGDSLLFVAGAISALPDMPISVHILVIILFAAAVLGDSCNYMIGHFFGRKLFNNPNSRIFKQSYLEKTHEFYKKYGGKTIILARFVPIVRTFAPFVAGMGKMNYYYFMMYNLVGGALWVAVFCYAGYFFGDLPFVQENLKLLIVAIIFISVLPAIIEVVRAKLKRSDYYKKIKDLEREGDRLTHLIFDELGTTFITPFDREDIHDLASCMDDVIDGINSCAKRISIYNPRPISENGKELSRLIQEEAIYICKAMDELETFRKKPTLLREYCSKLHEIENQADDVYEFFITKLFEEEKDCIELIKIKEIMHELEKTTDAAEHVGKILKNLIVKYA